jgi:ABC-type transport system involved in multi-copper enzyme maturation permease subunit
MIPTHFHLMFLAELRKTLLRGSGMAAILIAAAVGLLAVAGMGLAQYLGSEAAVNGLPLDQIMDFSGVTTAGWALRARNFFLLPLLLLWATGASFAGELKDHTLRELLVRPVPRWSVLLAKLLALAVLSAITLVVTAVLSGGLGALLFGIEGEWGPLALGYLASWPSDLGLLSMGILVALLVRNVAGVVVGVVLYLALDLVVRLLLSLIGKLPSMELAAEIARFMPGQALAAWEGYLDAWSLTSWAGLAVLIVLCLAAALFRLMRMDVP